MIILIENEALVRGIEVGTLFQPQGDS